VREPDALLLSSKEEVTVARIGSILAALREMPRTRSGQ
jgi:hypothetical protein